VLRIQSVNQFLQFQSHIPLGIGDLASERRHLCGLPARTGKRRRQRTNAAQVHSWPAAGARMGRLLLKRHRHHAHCSTENRSAGKASGMCPQGRVNLSAFDRWRRNLKILPSAARPDERADPRAGSYQLFPVAQGMKNRPWRRTCLAASSKQLANRPG